jgi:hypothetical protein
MADMRLLLATLPLAAAALARQRAADLLTEEQRARLEWLQVAPPAAVDYLVAVADEPNHLIADVVIEAVWDADATGAASALEYVQAAVLDKAVFTLSWSLAGRTWSYAHHFEAIRLLFGDARCTSERYLACWREAGTDDTDVLEQAGLGAAELELLDANEED